MTRKLSPLAFAIALALVAPAALAQETSPSDAQTLDTLIVTGTRVADRTVAESTAPIDIITPEVLESTGTVELATALSRAVPSLNFPRAAINDGTDAMRPAQLRGLAPDHTLVLVNGKRYHPGALVNVNGSQGRSSSPVDLNSIPISAIERVEVLRDGASAQYGSDAIAGVINIVLKGAGSGGSVSATGGGYSAGDGRQYQALAHQPWSGPKRREVQGAIGRDPRNRLRMALVDLDHQAGKPAHTTLDLLANAEQGCWLRCTLHTGRTHQIRVHAASVGHPLLADELYGGKPAAGLQRQALHAWRLAFVHPVSGQELVFTAAPPADFQAALSAWGLGYNEPQAVL